MAQINNGTLTLRAPSAPAGAPIQRRDPLLVGDNNGVRFYFDSALPYSWPTAAAPTNGAAAIDLADKANGAWSIGGSTLPIWTDAGFSYSNYDSSSKYVAFPASVAADIWGNGTTDQQRALFVCYLKLPEQADWSDDGGLLINLLGIGNVSATNLATIGFYRSGSTYALRYFRNKASGVYDVVTLGLSTDDFGEFAQVAAWWDGAKIYLRVTTANGATEASLASTGNNANNFAGQGGYFGYTKLYGGGGAFARTDHAVFIENLRRSGRNPRQVVEADWTRKKARHDSGVYQ